MLRQQTLRELGRQTPDVHLRHPLCLELPAVAFAGREQHRHALATQPTRDEHHRIGRRRVQPVRVIDHTHHRLALGRRGNQPERRR